MIHNPDRTMILDLGSTVRSSSCYETETPSLLRTLGPKSYLQQVSVPTLFPRSWDLIIDLGFGNFV